MMGHILDGTQELADGREGLTGEEEWADRRRG
jgi:hypothetical protein